MQPSQSDSNRKCNGCQSKRVPFTAEAKPNEDCSHHHAKKRRERVSTLKSKGRSKWQKNAQVCQPTPRVQHAEPKDYGRSQSTAQKPDAERMVGLKRRLRRDGHKGNGNRKGNRKQEP
jgi:hypothetical protein